MKTNHSARRLVRIRVVLFCLALAAIAGGEFRIGESVAALFGQVTSRQAEFPQAPNVSLADLMAAAR